MPSGDLLWVVRLFKGETWPRQSPVAGSPSRWMPGASSRRSARSGCTWPPRARPSRRLRSTPRRCSGSLPPACCRTGWEEVCRQDVQEWMAWLLGRYSAAYASNQFRALQQFFKWVAAEEEVPDPMAGMGPPRVPERPVPVFADGDLARLERACAGRSFQQRRDAAMIAVFRATGMRLSELAGIRYDPDEPGRSDLDCGTGRSPSTARAARPVRSRSATTPPAPSTGTFAPGPGTPRPTGRNCGSASTTAGR